jgi:hypothetical protein
MFLIVLSASPVFFINVGASTPFFDLLMMLTTWSVAVNFAVFFFATGFFFAGAFFADLALALGFAFAAA